MESVDFLAMCTCIYSPSRERKRLFGFCFNPRPGFRVGKISQCACAFLDESLAWVLRKSLFYECRTSACNSPLAFAILRRSARSIPMFRADFLPFTSKIVEHSRYLPVFPLQERFVACGVNTKRVCFLVITHSRGCGGERASVGQARTRRFFILPSVFQIKGRPA